MSAETRVPSIPAVSSANLQSVASAIKMLLDVREGRAGDPLDANVTYRDLLQSGLAQLRGGWTINSGSPSPVIPAGSDPDGYNPVLDFTTPPAPTGFTATGLFAVVQLQWTRPTYRNHSYAEVWRSSTNVIGNAVLIGTTDTSFYTDSIGSSGQFFYWVRFVSQANITGPYNATGGTLAQTATNPDLVLQSLVGQISETELNQSLTSRINLVDGPSSLSGSVNARILSESQARSSGDSALASSINSLSATVSSNQSALSAAISTESQARASADSALSSQIATLSSAISSNELDLSAALEIEAVTRASTDDGLLAQFTVKVDVNGYVSGFGLASTARDARAISSFIVRADNFLIGSPTGPGITPADPFIVRTTPTTIGGVSVPVGVYISDAFIQNGTITNAKIANLAVDNAKIANIDAAKINAGFISADRIQAGTLDAKIANISAAVITSGTLNIARIADASITSAKIASLDAAKITATTLSAITANAGTITAGVLRSADNKFVIDLNNKTIVIEV